MGQKEGASVPLLQANLDPCLTQWAWAEAYLPAKWHLDPPAIWPQQIWAENWGLCPFGRELGPHLAECGQGLPACQGKPFYEQLPKKYCENHQHKLGRDIIHGRPSDIVAE